MFLLKSKVFLERVEGFEGCNGLMSLTTLGFSVGIGLGLAVYRCRDETRSVPLNSCAPKHSL